MSELDQRIAPLKRKLSATAKEIIHICEKGRLAVKDEQHINMFKGMYMSVEKYYSKFESIWEELYDLYEGSDKQAEDLITDKDKKLKNTVRDYYYEVNSNYIILSQSSTPSPKPNISLCESHIAQNLPKISLPRFDGQITNWPKFRDTYCSLVHNDPSISPMQKYHYLVSSLSGAASTTVIHLPLQEDNYALAWKTLCDAFNNKRMLATAYLNELINFKSLQGRTSIESLKSFLSKVTDNIAAFKLLRIENESDFILFYLANKCLDVNTREQFEFAHKHIEFPSFESLSKFVRERCLALQLVENTTTMHFSSPSTSTSKVRPHNFLRSKTSLFTNGDANKKTSTSSGCVICNERWHPLLNCAKFHSSTVDQRLKWLKDWNGCRNCLSAKHKTASCSSKWHCRFCKYRHHSMLHKQSELSTSTLANTTGSHSLPDKESTACTTNSTSTVLNSTSNSNVHVILGTVLAEILDSRGESHKIRMVIDSGSQYSFITQRMCTNLGLTMTQMKNRICGIGQTNFGGVKGLVFCTIRPRHDKTPHMTTDAVVVNDITSLLPSVSLPLCIQKTFQQYDLADPQFFRPQSIDFLLGADLYGEIGTGSPITVDEHFPKLYPSIFGHIVLGRYKDSVLDYNYRTSLFVANDLGDELLKFWELEEPCVYNSIKNPDDELCETHFMETHYRQSSGRYVVRLPFKEDRPSLDASSTVALKRFFNLEEKLEKNLELKAKYHDFMREYIDLAHMNPTISTSKYLIPHHSVLKEDRNESKLRVVFDASAKTSQGSLNDYLMVGPKLQMDIREILLNFRSHVFVFVTDIVKMYRNILLNPEDRSYQHIFWRFDGEPVQTFELNTVTYGIKSAPFLALRVIRQLCLDEGDAFPQAASAIQRDIYVDDLLTGSDSVEAILELQRQVTQLMRKGEFTLSKWASNCTDIISTSQHTNRNLVTFSSQDDVKVKILGLQWDPQNDCFSYKINPSGSVYTKRIILSTIAKIYDPLGFLCPTIFLMKCIMQELWKANLDWDERISEKLSSSWEDIVANLDILSTLKIPRFVCASKPYTYQVIGFSDASVKGYCATLYLRVIKGNSIQVHLLTAKTKLAPLKTISIPRLELSGAHLLARLYKSIKQFLTLLPPGDLKSYMFTDSSIVLGWLNTPPYKLKTFVANRVVEIVDLSSTVSWRHIASEQNPADCGSRGLLPEHLINHQLWWSGPYWLQTDESHWPMSSSNGNEELPELKLNHSALISTKKELILIPLMTRFSSYYKLLRIVAWILRFIHNLKLTGPRNSGPLQSKEVELALMECVKAIQLLYFFEGDIGNIHAVQSKYKTLSPFLDGAGVLRVGGRLKNSNLSFTHKYPMLVPKKTHFSDILVDYYHQMYLHSGPTFLQAIIRTKFWIPSIRRLIQQRISKCIKCCKIKAKTIAPVMGNLPSYRLIGERAFLHVGVDFAGPFILRESLRRKAHTFKGYLCLFICMSTKALHLESVTNLTTEAFLSTFDRFTSRRGLPTNMYSDCGTNFVGAANHLKDLWHWYNNPATQDQILKHSVKRGIEWNFNPPHSPHFGGIWEAGVKSVKGLLRKITGETPLTYEEISTYFTKIEAILNSRPLYAMSNSPSDCDYLSPGHFLIGVPLLSSPEPSLLNCKDHLITRWQMIKKMSEHFWKRWRLEYLSTLQQRNKWTKAIPNLNVDDVVIIKDDNAQVMDWPIGRVTETHPGNDEVVRVATVKTSTSTYKRPVTKLVKLPLT